MKKKKRTPSAHKKKQNKVEYNKIPLYVAYQQECIQVIEDTLGKDGPYSGYREDVYDYRVKGVYTMQPQHTCYWDPMVLQLEKDNEEVPQIVHVVYVRYSTGGTFSHSRGCGTLVGVFADYNVAIDTMNQIRDGKFKGYRPWEGYFERFEDVCLDTQVVVK